MLCFITITGGRTLCGLTTSLVCKMDRVDRPYMDKTSTQVHKVDGPHKGSRFLSTRWTDPTGDKDSCPQSGRTQRGSKTYISPKSGRIPRGIKIHVHTVDGPNKGKFFYVSPQSERTPKGVKIRAHKVDGPN